MNKFFALAFLLLYGFAQAQTQPTILKIGYINIDQVVKNSPQFISAQIALNMDLAPKKRRLSTLAKKIQRLEKQLTNDKSSDKSAKNKRLIKLKQRFDSRMSALQKHLVSQSEKVLAEIQQLINQVIDELAQAQKFDLILYQEVAYASKKVDITVIVAKKLQAFAKK